MILDEIVAAKRVELKRARAERPLRDLRAEARSTAPSRPFALRHKDEVSIIAEIKRASPSKGDLFPDLDPATLARQYVEGGARALSVLTDAPFFKGSAGDLRAAREAADLPVLRKDFIIDEYQLWETRLMPADAVLLITRILDRAQLQEYLAMAGEELGLAALVEVHAEKELEQALDAGASIVGINNRDLETFRVSLSATERLRPMIPEDRITVSESGLSCREDIVFLRQLGIDAALIGEELVTSGGPVARIRELRGTHHVHPGNQGRH